MSKETYDESDIKTLSEIEHIRQNAGMYIGQTANPTHLLYEILDNALDEANGGHADLVLVSVDQKNHIYTVADNGRGIPFKDNTIVKISTKLFTGGKFKKGEGSKAYKAAIGLHGIGLVAVTALSEWMDVTVYRENKVVYYKFEDCKVVKHTIQDFDSAKKPCSTRIRFKPSDKYFESLEVDEAAIRNRMELASVHIDKLRLIFMNGKVQDVIKMTMEDYFKKNFFGKSDPKNHTPIFEYTEKIKDEKLRIVFAWDMNTYSQPVTGGSVNLLAVGQGTHINRTMLAFQNVFENIAKKEKLNFNTTDFRVGLRVYTSIELYETQYNSQTKEKLTNSKASIEHLYAKAEKKIEEILRSDEAVFNRVVYFVDNYRKSLTAKKTIVKSSGAVTRYNQSIDSKLKDCSSTDVEKCELFITEGDSASGGLVQCRNPMYHAILGLRGKVPNIADGKTDYLKNKEFVEIINAVGTGCGRDFDISKIRYKKICLAVDADPDGDHIAVLLIAAMLRIFPEIVKAGYVYTVVMPLYGVREFEGKFLPFYSEEEMRAFVEKHPNVQVTRYKGLGEMMPNQLAECMLNPRVRRLKQIKCEDSEIEPIFKLLTDSESKRDLVLED